MVNKIHKPPMKNNIRTQKGINLKVLSYKALIAVSLLLIILLTKNINSGITNRFISIIDKSINYDFNVVEDSKKIFTSAKGILSKSIKSISVFNSELKYISPVQGVIYRSFDQDIRVGDSIKKNSGLDIKVEGQENPISITNGKVVLIEEKDNKGKFITVENDNLSVVYGYLSKTYVTKGQSLEVGDVIGVVGTNKDGNKYLRLEIFKDGMSVDPLKYIDLQ